MNDDTTMAMGMVLMAKKGIMSVDSFKGTGGDNIVWEEGGKFPEWFKPSKKTKRIPLKFNKDE